ncbi:hypothetical protein KIPB_002385 [Kipferlia bialata]|uniref:Uncharacterized protein n=1 Tax=Kipferlia bialata TaxID=797122 RepID=A0A9K3CS43_9EUKA|nr:hypothetical protein KIPB_002385 [Kipferlia bialata]|eukprot:g2385.t1
MSSDAASASPPLTVLPLSPSASGVPPLSGCLVAIDGYTLLHMATETHEYTCSIVTVHPDTATYSMETLTHPLAPSRTLQTMTVVGGQVYVFGGQTDQGVETSDLFTFDIGTKEWKQIPKGDGPWPPTRVYHSAYAYEGCLVVAGGVHKGMSPDRHPLLCTWAYDPVLSTWHSLPALYSPIFHSPCLCIRDMPHLVQKGGSALLQCVNTHAPTHSEGHIHPTWEAVPIKHTPCPLWVCHALYTEGDWLIVLRKGTQPELRRDRDRDRERERRDRPGHTDSDSETAANAHSSGVFTDVYVTALDTVSGEWEEWGRLTVDGVPCSYLTGCLHLAPGVGLWVDNGSARLIHTDIICPPN